MPAPATIRLGEIAHARSGDKGNHANIGVIAYSRAGFEFLGRTLTADSVAAFFQPLGPRQVERFALPGIGAYNFLLHDVLDGGASRSLRIDSQGKTLGLSILEMPFPRPDNLPQMLPEELKPFSAGDLPEVPGGWVARDYSLAGRTFHLLQPANPDAFLDDPDVNAAHHRDGYMPYWSYLWPTSLDLAAALLSVGVQPAEVRSAGVQPSGCSARSNDVPATHAPGTSNDPALQPEGWTPTALPSIRPGTAALELGCGIGLAGLAALSAGLDVTFSDYDVQAVRLALLNARRNGFEARGMFLDWRHPPTKQYPLVLGCDLVYERQNHAPIVAALEALLVPGGAAWIADPGRHQAHEFIDLARRHGFLIERHELPRQPYPSRPDGGTNLWILRKVDGGVEGAGV